MQLLRPLALLLIALAPFGPSAARASTTVYDTYVLPDGDVDAIVGQYNGKDLQLAYPVDVPAPTGFAPLESVTVRIRHSPDPTADKGDFRVLLREDNGGAPGAVLEEWSYTAPVPNETDVKFDSVAKPVLHGGSTYWLNMKIDPGTGIGLWISAEPKTSDLLYADTGDLDPVWKVPPQPYLIGFANVVVPEPAHAWLVLAGAAVLVPIRRRAKA